MKALVVDDETELAAGLARWLKDDGIDSETASSADEAQKKLTQKDFDLVISDIRMPGMTGVDLLNWIQKDKSQIRVILITGFTDYDAQEMMSLGCSGFLTKPVTKNELLESIRLLREDSEAEKSTGMTFSKIRLDSFLVGHKSPFSIYLKMTDGRFVKVANKDSQLESERLQRFKKNNVNELWVETSDFHIYLKLCRAINQAANKTTSSAKDEGAVGEKARNMAKHLIEVSYEGLRSMGVNEVSLKTAVQDLRSIYLPCLSKKNWADNFDQYQINSESMYSQAAMSANLMLAVVRLMGWQSTKNIEALIIGTFLRDISLSGRDQLAAMPLESMSEEEKEFYLSHPPRSAETLRQLPGITPATLLIIEQHHEHLKGCGFPAALSASRIFPMAKMVSTLDQVMNCIIPKSGEPQKTKQEIKDQLLQLEGQVLDHATYIALAGLLIYPTYEKAKEFFSQNAYAIGARPKFN
jgi:YesN/AraC family two-component response regulator